MDLGPIDTLKDQWQRAKSGLSIQLPEAENKLQEFSGGLVIIGLEQQQKEQRERQEAFYMETNLVSESGLDTDEIIFLEEQEEKKYLFREQQKQEIAEFKEAVSKKVFKSETTYIEDLYNANKKKKLANAKKKRKPVIGFATPVNLKKPKTDNSTIIEIGEKNKKTIAKIEEVAETSLDDSKITIKKEPIDDDIKPKIKIEENVKIEHPDTTDVSEVDRQYNDEGNEVTGDLGGLLDYS